MNQKTKIVKLVADPYPPYQYQENDTVKGIDHDIIVSTFKEHETDTEIQLFPWESCIELMENKKVDGIFQIAYTPEREKTFLFSRPFRTARTVFLRNASTLLEFEKNVEISLQLKTYRIGVLSGYSYDPAIDSLPESARTEVKGQEMLLEGLLRGRFDLALMDSGVATYLIGKMNIGGIERVEGYEIKRQLHVAFQKDRYDLANLFNVGFEKIKEKGIYNEVFKDYGVVQ